MNIFIKKIMHSPLPILYFKAMQIGKGLPYSSVGYAGSRDVLMHKLSFWGSKSIGLTRLPHEADWENVKSVQSCHYSKRWFQYSDT